MSGLLSGSEDMGDMGISVGGSFSLKLPQPLNVALERVPELSAETSRLTALSQVLAGYMPVFLISAVSLAALILVAQHRAQSRALSAASMKKRS